MKNIMSRIAGALGLMTRDDVAALLSLKAGGAESGPGPGVVEKSSEWSRLWEMVQEHKLNRGNVSRPYEQIPSIYKAVKAIADNVPQADLRFYDKASKREIESDEIIDLFNSPNPLMTEADLIQALVGFIALYGEGFLIKEVSVGNLTGARKLPAELWPFNPTVLKEVVEGRRITAWRYDKENIVYTPDQVLQIKDFNPYHIFRGMAPTKPIEKMIDIDWSTMLYNKAFFDNDATPGLLLSTDQTLNDDVVKRMRLQWEQRFKGASNAFKLAICESGLKPTSTASNHKEMEFMEQKRFVREEMMGIWRAPKALFNITEDLNYATFIGQMKMFWNYVIMPILHKLEDTINRGIVVPYNPRIVAKFDLSNVVAFQEDLKDKTETAGRLFAIGFTRNEINERLQLGFDPAPWGDVWWAPFGLAPVSSDEMPVGGGDGVDEDADGGDDAPGKSADELRRLGIWRGFLAKQGPLENKFAAMMKRYLYEQRSAVIKAFTESKGASLGIKWDEQDAILKDKATQYISQSVREGVDIGRAFLQKKSVSDDQLDTLIRSFTAVRAENITGINRTTAARIKETLEKGIAQGDTIMMLTDRIRAVFNAVQARSLMIARTETTGAVNGGSELYYQAEGVKKKEWLTARDEHVRESHQQIDGDVVDTGKRFENGLMYPGDQTGDAGEVVNCRCTIIPVV